MLLEIANVAQHDAALRRRWFRDDYFDIFIWQDARDAVVAFQICYDLPNQERVLSWRAAGGYTHDRVDGGESSPEKNRTPIMIPDGVLPLIAVLTEFDQRAAGLEPGVRDRLRRLLRAYSAGTP